jgi:methylmalonyl-CoA mutase
MTFPPVMPAEWRALVEKELAGRPFEKALVRTTDEGLAVAPLYTERPRGPLPSPEPPARAFRVCTRPSRGDLAAELASDLNGGADALWLALDALPDGALAPDALARTFFVFDPGAEPLDGALARLESLFRTTDEPLFALNHDPLGDRARGRAPFASLAADLAALGRAAGRFEGRFRRATWAMVSTLPYHDAGADAADELAIALSTGALYLGALLDAGLPPERAAGQIALQVSAGRDTFLELCKLRALRVCWQKLTAAVGAKGAPRATVHAVCSARTLTVRDPWVNLLRVTTQLFAAISGGADLVTPAAFDEASGAPSPLARRVARNTGLVLREESFLGKVSDPAGGSYYLETLTDELAREAWRRFQALEREGGVASALESKRLSARLEAAWGARLKRLARREAAVVGVSDFANLNESLPRPAPAEAPPQPEGALPARRDAEAFEALRARAEAKGAPPEALLVTLGSYAESRPRAGFAAGFFAAGGIRSRESAEGERAPLACLCGSDERYAAEAADRARSLKAAGCGRVLLAGRPGPLEASLREAGVDGFIFVGCDAVATLSDLLEGLS